jgi:hypothetical protein
MAAAQGKDQDFGTSTQTESAAESKVAATSDEAMASLKEQAKGKTVGDTVSAAFMDNGQVKVYTASVNESGIGLVSTRDANTAERAVLQGAAKTLTNPTKETGARGIANNVAELPQNRLDVEGTEGKGNVVFETANEYFSFITNIGKRTDLTKHQKLAQILEAYEGLKNKGDVTVVSDVKFLKEQGFDLSTGRMLVDWPPKMGFAEDSIKSITRNNPLPNKWDRDGSIRGENFTVIPNNRLTYSYSEKAIPYLQNASAHHIGTFNNSIYYDVIDAIKDNNISNINKMMSNLGKNELTQTELDIIRDQYNYFQNRVKNEIGNINADYGLKGYAAAWKNSSGETLLTGGAEQIVTPLKGDILKRLGVIGE